MLSGNLVPDREATAVSSSSFRTSARPHQLIAEPACQKSRLHHAGLGGKHELVVSWFRFKTMPRTKIRIEFVQRHCSTGIDVLKPFTDRGNRFPLLTPQSNSLFRRHQHSSLGFQLFSDKFVKALEVGGSCGIHDRLVHLEKQADPPYHNPIDLSKTWCHNANCREMLVDLNLTPAQRDCTNMTMPTTMMATVTIALTILKTLYGRSPETSPVTALMTTR